MKLFIYSNCVSVNLFTLFSHHLIQSLYCQNDSKNVISKCLLLIETTMRRHTTNMRLYRFEIVFSVSNLFLKRSVDDLQTSSVVSNGCMNSPLHTLSQPLYQSGRVFGICQKMAHWHFKHFEFEYSNVCVCMRVYECMYVREREKESTKFY